MSGRGPGERRDAATPARQDACLRALENEFAATMSVVFRLSPELGRTVVAVTGEPSFDEARVLYDALVELIDGDGELNVVLDLRGLASMTPAIALVLDTAGTLVRERGGRLLAGPLPPEQLATLAEDVVTVTDV